MDQSTGYLTVRTSTARQAVPVSGARVSVFCSNNFSDPPCRTSVTDSSGQSELFELPAPPRANSEDPDSSTPYETYAVQVTHPNYIDVLVEDVSIFSGVASTLPVSLIPSLPNQEERVIRLSAKTGPQGSGGVNG